MLLGRKGNYLQGDGEMNALISGIKGAQTTLGASPFAFGRLFKSSVVIDQTQ